MISLFNVYKGQKVREEERVIDSSTDKLLERIKKFEQDTARSKIEKRYEDAQNYLRHLPKDDLGNPILEKDEDGNIIIPQEDDGSPFFMIDDDGEISLALPDDRNKIDNAYEIAVQANNPQAEDISEEDGSEEIEEAVESPSETLEQARQEAEAIINDANAQADEIVGNAQAEAANIKIQASADGRNEGFQQGCREADEQYQRKQDELDEERQRLEADYHTRSQSLEKDTVDTVCDIVAKVFGIEYFDNKEIVRYLVDNALNNITGSKEYLIRVNDANYDFLNEHRDELQEKTGADVSFEIIKDATLDSQKILIETDSGVFDCSMDTQMNNLIKDLKALSISQ